MARYREARCRLCRREGTKLFLKGDRCFTDKCAFERRPFAPGMHGRMRKKLTDYAIQLREKQKVKRLYGVLERQFKNYFKEAARQKGATGANLLILLERRLDNVVYRLGFAESRTQARQLIRHGHFLVNGKKVDIPSFLVRENDVVEVKAKSKEKLIFKNALETLARKGIPGWLEVDENSLKGVVKAMPTREDITFPINEQLIVELYSK
ncbi:small subunit ribosomal protein S4 [Desulfonauticus submarinus]|uniref:Small ribosomal subunit protein uS4 n=1 Tax=Desulfonauticus submarinus TaxID=206665 RepID=A0A1H0G403_9BACT|nr:30S ribosomal protein S4 [Desulfonauticus submarinus]SDO01606.1 small subunit ribosomal protein S4 [Desulfonauticus submarinus]